MVSILLWVDIRGRSQPLMVCRSERKEIWMQVGNVMQRTVVTVTPEMSLAEVQRLMREQRIRHLPVVSRKKLVGIVTDRNIRDAVPSPATTLSRSEIAY